MHRLAGDAHAGGEVVRTARDAGEAGYGEDVVEIVVRLLRFDLRHDDHVFVGPLHECPLTAVLFDLLRVVELGAASPAPRAPTSFGEEAGVGEGLRLGTGLDVGPGHTLDSAVEIEVDLIGGIIRNARGDGHAEGVGEAAYVVDALDGIRAVFAVDANRVEADVGGEFDELRRRERKREDKSVAAFTVGFEDGVFNHVQFLLEGASARFTIGWGFVLDLLSMG